jgi:hypothetical protein
MRNVWDRVGIIVANAERTGMRLDNVFGLTLEILAQDCAISTASKGDCSIVSTAHLECSMSLHD